MRRVVRLPASAQLFSTPAPLTERQWQTAIEDRLKAERYLYQHVYRMQTPRGGWRTSTTAVGWPDLVAIRDQWLVVIECKGAKGRVEPDQLTWLAGFAAIPTARVWVLRPTDDWQDVANWIHQPEHAPRTFGWEPRLLAS
jgi:hypothetical protein